MNRKERRHKSTAPERSRHLSEHEKQQEHTNYMQQHIGEMMAASLSPIELIIKHVRKRGEWMPIVAMTVCECQVTPRRLRPLVTCELL
jgi:hypothetical protein